MTLFELIKLLRVHLKPLVVVALAAAIICGAGYALKTAISPVYTAKAYVVTTGGAFNAVSGLADKEALSNVTVEGATVEASATTAQNMITFTAKAPTSSQAISAANQAASSLADLATANAGVTNAAVTSAAGASLAGKGPLLYVAVGLLGGLFCAIIVIVLRDSMRGGVCSPQVVAERGLTFLGELQNDQTRMRIVLANFQFTGKSEGAGADAGAGAGVSVGTGAGASAGSSTILLHPTNKKVHLQEACDMLTPAANEVQVALRMSLPLEESVDTLYQGSKVTSVVVVVEEYLSTIAEVEEIVHEFALAGIHVGGFVYLPYTKHKK